MSEAQADDPTSSAASSPSPKRRRIDGNSSGRNDSSSGSSSSSSGSSSSGSSSSGGGGSSENRDTRPAEQVGGNQAVVGNNVSPLKSPAPASKSSSASLILTPLREDCAKNLKSMEERRAEMEGRYAAEASAAAERDQRRSKILAELEEIKGADRVFNTFQTKYKASMEVISEQIAGLRHTLGTGEVGGVDGEESASMGINPSECNRSEGSPEEKEDGSLDHFSDDEDDEMQGALLRSYQESAGSRSLSEGARNESNQFPSPEPMDVLELLYDMMITLPLSDVEGRIAVAQKMKHMDKRLLPEGHCYHGCTQNRMRAAYLINGVCGRFAYGEDPHELPKYLMAITPESWASKLEEFQQLRGSILRNDATVLVYPGVDAARSEDKSVNKTLRSDSIFSAEYHRMQSWMRFHQCFSEIALPIQKSERESVEVAPDVISAFESAIEEHFDEGDRHAHILRSLLEETNADTDAPALKSPDELRTILVPDSLFDLNNFQAKFLGLIRCWVDAVLSRPLAWCYAAAAPESEDIRAPSSGTTGDEQGERQRKDSLEPQPAADASASTTDGPTPNDDVDLGQPGGFDADSSVSSNKTTQSGQSGDRCTRSEDQNDATNESDNNDDVCAVCNDGGELLCCGTCNRAYHLACVVPKLSSVPPGDWKCAYCLADCGSEDEKSNALKAISAMEQNKNAGELDPASLVVGDRVLVEHTDGKSYQATVRCDMQEAGDRRTIKVHFDGSKKSTVHSVSVDQLIRVLSKEAPGERPAMPRDHDNVDDGDEEVVMDVLGAPIKRRNSLFRVKQRDMKRIRANKAIDAERRSDGTVVEVLSPGEWNLVKKAAPLLAELVDEDLVTVPLAQLNPDLDAALGGGNEITIFKLHKAATKEYQSAIEDFLSVKVDNMKEAVDDEGEYGEHLAFVLSRSRSKQLQILAATVAILPHRDTGSSRQVDLVEVGSFTPGESRPAFLQLLMVHNKLRKKGAATFLISLLCVAYRVYSGYAYPKIVTGVGTSADGFYEDAGFVRRIGDKDIRWDDQPESVLNIAEALEWAHQPGEQTGTVSRRKSRKQSDSKQKSDDPDPTPVAIRRGFVERRQKKNANGSGNAGDDGDGNNDDKPSKDYGRGSGEGPDNTDDAGDGESRGKGGKGRKRANANRPKSPRPSAGKKRKATTKRLDSDSDDTDSDDSISSCEERHPWRDKKRQRNKRVFSKEARAKLDRLRDEYKGRTKSDNGNEEQSEPDSSDDEKADEEQSEPGSSNDEKSDGDDEDYSADSSDTEKLDEDDEDYCESFAPSPAPADSTTAGLRNRGRTSRDDDVARERPRRKTRGKSTSTGKEGEKRDFRVVWRKKSQIRLGTFTEEEGSQNLAAAYEKISEWREIVPLPDKDWVTKQLEDEGLRVVVGQGRGKRKDAKTLKEGEKRDFEVYWEKSRIGLGRFPEEEGLQKRNAAYRIIDEWRKMKPLPDKDWVTKQLEDEGLRVRVGRPRAKSLKEGEKERFRVSWQKSQISLGQFTKEEGSQNLAAANKKIGEWKKRVPLPDKDWVTKQLEDEGLRVMGKPGRKRKAKSGKESFVGSNDELVQTLVEFKGKCKHTNVPHPKSTSDPALKALGAKVYDARRRFQKKKISEEDIANHPLLGRLKQEGVEFDLPERRGQDQRRYEGQFLVAFRQRKRKKAKYFAHINIGNWDQWMSGKGKRQKKKRKRTKGKKDQTDRRPDFWSNRSVREQRSGNAVHVSYADVGEIDEGRHEDRKVSDENEKINYILNEHHEGGIRNINYWRANSSDYRNLVEGQLVNVAKFLDDRRVNPEEGITMTLFDVPRNHKHAKAYLRRELRDGDEPPTFPLAPNSMARVFKKVQFIDTDGFEPGI
ncbi:hypothetical protein ACHAXT_005291 [Thalassiosira profunda]